MIFATYDLGAVVGGGRTAPFVGRSAELAILAGALDEAIGGIPSLVFVGGEAGIGKTRLVDEFEARSAPRALFVVGRCHPAIAGGGNPYGPLAEIVRELRRRLGPERLTAVIGPEAARLSMLLPELDRSWRPARAEDTIDARVGARVRLQATVMNVIDRIQRETPLVVALEDMHWADAATLDATSYVVRSLRNARVVIVVTVRTDDAAIRSRRTVLTELERAPSVYRVELRRLTRDEVREQMAGSLGRTPDDAEVSRICARSDGNPFFVEELLGAESRGETTPITPRLEDLMRARFDAVSGPTRALLGAAAIGGPAIDDGLLAAVTGLAPERVEAGLREAVASELIVRPARAPGEWAFRHTLLREYIADELLPGEARTLHGAWATVLSAADADLVAGEVARHWLLAGRADRALPAAVSAGLAAERHLAFAEARTFFDAALDLWDRRPELAEADVLDLDHVGVLQHASDAAALTGALDRAIRLARRAIGEIDEAAEPRRAAYVHERLRWFLWEGGDPEAAERALLEAHRLIPDEPPSAARARVLGQLAGVRLRQRQLSEATNLAGEAIDVARRVGGLAELGFALGVRGWVHVMTGLDSNGLDDIREAGRIANLLEAAEGRAMAASNLSLALLYVGRAEDALDSALQGREDVRSVGLAALFDARLATTAAAACYRLGRWPEAVVLCRSVANAELRAPDRSWFGAVATRLAAATGDQHLLDAAGRVDAAPVHPWLLEPLCAEWSSLARLESAPSTITLDDPTFGAAGTVTAATIDAARAEVAASSARLCADRAVVARATGDEAAAAAQVGLARGVARAWRAQAAAAGSRIADPGGVAVAEAMLVAEVARASGRSDARRWIRLAELSDEAGLPYPAAYARYRHAEALVSGGAPSPRARTRVRATAGDEARAALAVARTLGARPLAHEIETFMARARLPVDAPSPTDAARPAPVDDSKTTFVVRRGLTQREVEVLGLVAAGWTNGEIGDALFIARKTVSVHVSNILGKLRAANRVEAAAIAHHVGIVGPRRPGSEAAAEAD